MQYFLRSIISPYFLETFQNPYVLPLSAIYERIEDAENTHVKISEVCGGDGLSSLFINYHLHDKAYIGIIGT